MFPAQRGQSAGSGVIVGSDGYVLTNNHVLGQGALQQVTVILSDRRERPAKLVGIDPHTDLALLKIDERNLPAVTWGDSAQLKVAEWVLAVGNPYQLGQTVTLGIVSGLNRTYEDVSTIVDYIQTDAAINPRQLGRRADQPPRRAGRHQHVDLLAERRRPGHRLRHPEQHRAPRRRRDHPHRRR